MLTWTVRVKPTNYHVSLYDLQLGSTWGYKGTLKIDLKVTRSTKEIVLNSKEIQVQNAEVLGENGMYTACVRLPSVDKADDLMCILPFWKIQEIN